MKTISLYTDIDGLWEIYQTIQNLVALPHQGHRRPDLAARPMRLMRVHDFLMAYVPDEKPLLILGHHPRRQPQPTRPCCHPWGWNLNPSPAPARKSSRERMLARAERRSWQALKLVEKWKSSGL